MSNSIANFYHSLSYHPAIAEKHQQQQSLAIVIAADNYHQAIAQKIAEQCPFSHMDVAYYNLEQTNNQLVLDKLLNSDLFVLFYAASTLTPPQPTGPNFISDIKTPLTKVWKKSVLFKDYGEHFYTAFAEPIEQIKQRNQQLISIANKAKTVRFFDQHGGQLTGQLSDDHRWTSIDGFGNHDVVAGEIASHVRSLSGEITFSGTFLSTIPFARKYGIVDKFLHFTVDNGKVVDFHCDNAHFTADFRQYLDNIAGNRVVEEFGIGTNAAIKQLYGLNAGFEERHPGLHLGLGGGEKGSHHLDLIFSSGKIAFDDQVVFDNGLLI